MGSLWVTMTIAWAWACMWVDRDARQVFGVAKPWAAVFVWIGVILLVGTMFGGTAGLLMIGALLPMAMASYLAYRERAAPAKAKLVRADRAFAVLSGLAGLVGLDSLIDRLRRSIPATPESPDGEPPIILLKKDGTPYSGGYGRLDQTTADAVQAAQRILGKAITLRATDIHFEPKSSQEYQVRYRIDGIMQTRQVVNSDAARSVVSALKVLADMDIAERRRPQDGTFAACVAKRRFDVRAASGPTNFGEKMSLRLLDADGGIVRDGFKGLGMRTSVVSSLRGLITRPHGMLIVTGPTGSGKTTTLYACLNEIDVLTRNVVTIEDPVEYRLENISQTAVNVAADLTFAKILRSVLRQDPDVILVGEIRDRETAEIAMQAALTGHFVFTTLHANDTATTVTRLIEMGVDISLIESAVSAVLAQRLIRVLCPECKQGYEPSREVLRRLGIPSDRVQQFFKERGCDACQGTGYRGRTGVYELMMLDSEIRSLLVGRPSLEAVRGAARKAGMRTMWQSALYKVVNGETSLTEAERVVR